MAQPPHQPGLQPQLSSQPQPTSLSKAHITCLCQTIHEPATFLSPNTHSLPVSSPSQPLSLPIPCQLCHCKSCRLCTGNICAAGPRLQHPPSAATLSRLTCYKSSRHLARFFCHVCGCHCFVFHGVRGRVDIGETAGGHVFVEGDADADAAGVVREGQGQGEGYWCVGGGAVDIDMASDVTQGRPVHGFHDILRISSHIHVADTRDGGVVPRLLAIDDVPVRVFARGAHDDTDDEHSDGRGRPGVISAREILETQISPQTPTRPTHNQGEAPSLRAGCHCGAVKLLITRADHATGTSGGLSSQMLNNKNANPQSRKFNACLSARRSDRLSSGAWALQAWCTIPLANIAIAFGGPDDQSQGTMTMTMPLTKTSLFAMPDPDQDPEHCTPLSQAHDRRELTSKMTVFSSLPQTGTQTERFAFCTTCGATVFHWSNEQPRSQSLPLPQSQPEPHRLQPQLEPQTQPVTQPQPESIDVAVGILRADEGSLAQDWLEWSWDVVGAGEALEVGLVQAIRSPFSG